MPMWLERIALVAFAISVPIGVIGFAIYLLTGGLYSFALRPLQRRFEGIELHEELKPGDVYFVYHTYRGLLLWCTQSEHRVIAPAADAQRLLRRLLWFNLTWGMLSYGMIFIPLLAIGNYFSQQRAIRKQMAAFEQAKSDQKER
jgi:preprotein translocase subunit YajC